MSLADRLAAGHHLLSSEAAPVDASSQTDLYRAQSVSTPQLRSSDLKVMNLVVCGCRQEIVKGLGSLGVGTPHHRSPLCTQTSVVPLFAEQGALPAGVPPNRSPSWSQKRVKKPMNAPKPRCPVMRRHFSLLTACHPNERSVRLRHGEIAHRELPTKRRRTELSVSSTGSINAIGRHRSDGARFCIPAAEFKLEISWLKHS